MHNKVYQRIEHTRWYMYKIIKNSTNNNNREIWHLSSLYRFYLVIEASLVCYNIIFLLLIDELDIKDKLHVTKWKKNPILYLYGFFMYLHGHLKYFFLNRQHLQNVVYLAFFFKQNHAIFYISYINNPTRTRWIITNNNILIWKKKSLKLVIFYAKTQI